MSEPTARHPIFYEPWVPQPGDLVRVQVSHECPVIHLMRPGAPAGRLLGPSHYAGQPCQPSWADGYTGEVKSVARYPLPDDDGTDVDNGHDFYVSDSGDCDHFHYLDDCFAAVELEFIHRPSGGAA